MSSETKNSITLLCKLLNLLYKTNLKPQYFRLAKFNKTDENVVPVLWNLLINILDEDNVDMVKRKLHHLNYNRNQFYSCTKASSQSRELLLVLSFLISIYIEDNVNNILLNKSVLSDNYDPLENQQFFQHNMTNNGHQHFDWQKLSRNDLENYKKWLYGKMHSNKNLTREYKEHICKMQEKINKFLNIKANGSLTTYEILALKNKLFGEEFIRDTEPVLNVLNLYIEWLKKEKYFWKWMESVLWEEKKELKPEPCDKHL